MTARWPSNYFSENAQSSSSDRHPLRRRTVEVRCLQRAPRRRTSPRSHVSSRGPKTPRKRQAGRVAKFLVDFTGRSTQEQKCPLDQLCLAAPIRPDRSPHTNGALTSAARLPSPSANAPSMHKASRRSGTASQPARSASTSTAGTVASYTVPWWWTLPQSSSHAARRVGSSPSVSSSSADRHREPGRRRDRPGPAHLTNASDDRFGGLIAFNRGSGVSFGLFAGLGIGTPTIEPHARDPRPLD